MSDFKTALYQIIGEKIKNKRKEQGISQVDLADFLHLSRSSISNIEVGRHQIPLFVLYKICNYLRVEINDLIPSNDEITKKMSLLDPNLKDLFEKENLTINEIDNIQNILKDLEK